MERTLPDMIGESQIFLDALAHASATAQIDRPVLILGERGTGKELFAGRIHFLSPRWDRPFVKVNCAALSEELLESELFGHEAGAFTGASKRHAGRFERAEGGTLFLDEIGTASGRIQEKLLRVIEYGEYERIGGEETRIANVRVIAATNADLRAEVLAKRFRADLLDRLAFEVVVAPPLRERVRDIPLLASYFANAFVRENSDAFNGLDFQGFAPLALQELMTCLWPGNIRELKSAVERSIHRWHLGGATGELDKISLSPFSEEMVIVAHLATSDQAPPITIRSADDATNQSYDLRQKLDQIEKDLTSAALERHGWNQRKAGDFLHLSYDQIRGLVKKHGLSQKASPKPEPEPETSD